MHTLYTLSRALRHVLVPALCWSWTVTECDAASFTVTIDTTTLASQTSPPGPFALEFQFNDGGGEVTNTLTLSQFDFGGGSATGTPTYHCTAGDGAVCTGIGGNLFTTVTLSDSNDAFNEFIQGFTPGSTGPLRFLVDLGTPQIESSTPDAFSLAVFDSSGTGILTTFFDVFVQFDLTSPLGINTYASDSNQPPPGCPTCAGINIGAPVVQFTTPVPGPNSLVLMCSGLMLLGTALRKKYAMWLSPMAKNS